MMVMMSRDLMAIGWIPGFPNYNGEWQGYEIAYFNGIAWHRKEQ
jgi:hypothetical protein